MLVAAILLLLGIFRIGLWYHNELAERQPAYQASRVAAGSNEIGKWPVYARRPLTENWVLKGGPQDFPLPGGQPGGVGTGRGRDRNTKCEEPANAKEEQAKNNIKQAYALEVEASQLESEAQQLENEAAKLENEAAELDKQADYYQKLYKDCLVNCDQYDEEYCKHQCLHYKQQADYYRDQAKQKRDQAQQKRNQAQQKREQAQQKRQEAQRLRDAAEQLFDEAFKIRENCWK